MKMHYKSIVTLLIFVLMATPLKIFSWNVKGMSSALCLNRTPELLDTDIAVICEP